MSAWKRINSEGELPKDDAKDLTVFTPPKTDAWRANPKHDVFDAPVVYKTIKKSAFKSVKVTVSGPWKTQFDQGGFMMVFPSPDGKPKQWVKAGIEYFEGQAKIGVVGTDRYSDWSLCPMPNPTDTEATLEAVLDEDKSTLWVYLINDGKRQPLREVKWAFCEESPADAELWVGVYAAKPTAEADGSDKGIEVSFKDFKLETSS